ncbi:MAG: peptidoglycan DD-metalloendopeptidase family protein [Bacteroidetes bacterium]|nr:peptidoglycan DD-metalloendopeptidase family protein [Bacteroidota bacterium]
MNNISLLAASLKKYQDTFHTVVPFTASKDKLVRMDFTSANKELTTEITNDTNLFSKYINQKIIDTGALYGIGGYNEYREFYSRSEMFNGSVPRRLHIGIDIWGEAGTPVFAFLGGMIHSFAFNNKFGDYGATMIVLHQIDGIAFYSLYGHLSLNDINTIQAGEYITRGKEIGHFGKPSENGNWPPHLHFQLIQDMEMNEGDYPGVCSLNDKDKYLINCPDPNLVLNMMQFAR